MATSNLEKGDVLQASADPSLDIQEKSEVEECSENQKELVTQVDSKGEHNAKSCTPEGKIIKSEEFGIEKACGGEAKAAEAEILPIPDSCIEHLTQGLLDAMLPHFQKHDESLSELTRNQVLLIETLQQENRKFSENTIVEDLTKMMQEAKVYQGKLTAIKKEMTSLHDKSSKLKRRALKLQQQKMKENLEKEQQREREIEEDRKLTAKRPNPSSSTKAAPHR